MTAPGAFPFDARMSGLATALDGPTMAALLRKYVRTANHQRLDVEHCRVVRLRYRPEQRCVVQYAVTVRDPRTSRSRRELVTGTLYGNPRRAVRRAKRVAGASLIPELPMVVHVFPSDRKLPQAPVLAAGGDAELKAIALGWFGGGEWRVDSWDTEVVRYREGLSLVIRYAVTAVDASTGERRRAAFYVKAYPDRDDARRAFALLQRLAEYSAAAPRTGRIQAPLACLESLGAILLAATPGRPLSEMLEHADDHALLAATEDSARTIARFNLSDAPVVRQFSTADYLKSLARAAALVARACPEVSTDVDRCVDSVRGLGHAELRPTHRDMKPEHVLIGAGGPGFIDLDSCAAADPVLDVALMLARFAAVAQVAAQPSRIAGMADAFAREYFAQVPQAWRDRLPAYYAASLLEVAAGLFHRQEDNWRTNIPKLMKTARASR